MKAALEGQATGHDVPMHLRTSTKFGKSMGTMRSSVFTDAGMKTLGPQQTQMLKTAGLSQARDTAREEAPKSMVTTFKINDVFEDKAIAAKKQRNVVDRGTG